MSRPLHLGFLLFHYFPFGGLQRDCLRTARECLRRGHRVTVFARSWDGPKPGDMNVQVTGGRGWTNVGRNRAWIRHMQAGLPQLGLDGVVGFNKMPGLDVYFGADPCYVARARRTRAWWYRWTFRYHHFRQCEAAVFQRGSRAHILLLTPWEIPVYQEIYGTEEERFHVLPPGVERRKVTEAARAEARRRIREEHAWLGEGPLLLLVGSGFRIKGLDRAIEALASLPDAVGEPPHLVVLGRGKPDRFATQARRAGVAGRVHFLGGRDDVPAWMLGADLLVHPAYSESGGMVLLEALTHGLPVLTTDTCGYAGHVAKAKAGVVLASPFRQGACNRALREMLASPTRSEWTRHGLAYAAREDLYSCHAKAADLIEQVIATRPRPGSRLAD